MTDHRSALERRAAIGWPRAIVTAVTIVAIGFVGILWLPQAIVGQVSFIGRDARAIVAATLAVLVVVAVAVLLRRLQARGLI